MLCEQNFAWISPLPSTFHAPFASSCRKETLFLVKPFKNSGFDELNYKLKVSFFILQNSSRNKGQSESICTVCAGVIWYCVSFCYCCGRKILKRFDSRTLFCKPPTFPFFSVICFFRVCYIRFRLAN
jgi:hypothetical protein